MSENDGTNESEACLPMYLKGCWLVLCFFGLPLGLRKYNADIVPKVLK